MTGYLRRSHAVVSAGLLCVVVLAFMMLRRCEPPVLPPELLRIEKVATRQYLNVPQLRYVNRSGLSSSIIVDFVGAVHLGERSYYESLNQAFKKYDVVLFELVSDGTAVPTKGGSQNDSLLGTMQRAVANLLGLAFQLDEIDYRASNFVHADLSPQQLSAAMEARGESLPQLLMKLLRVSNDPALERSLKEHGLDEASLEGINPLLIVLRGPTERERLILRRFMAQGLIASDEVLKILEGEKGFSLITDRNKVIVDTLEKEVTLGKKKIAIFYGVGHLPDLHRRLTNEHGYSLAEVSWNRAWNLSGE